MKRHFSFKSVRFPDGEKQMATSIKCPICKEKRLITRSSVLSSKKFYGYCRKCFEGGRVKGKIHPLWKGGKHKKTDGYVLIKLTPDHRFYSMQQKKGKGYTLEHRLIMAQKLNRPLQHFEQIHHLNGNKSDNRLKNLLLIDGSSHWLITKLEARIRELESLCV